MDLREFLAHFDFDYDIVSAGGAREENIRKDLLEDKKLTPQDMDKDLICLIDLQGAYFGDIGRERYPIEQASVEKIVDRMNTYINDSVLSDFEYELMARDVDCMGMSLEEMSIKCRELGVDEGCVSYLLADVICEPNKITLSPSKTKPSLDDMIDKANKKQAQPGTENNTQNKNFER